jgi:hypothetical protein
VDIAGVRFPYRREFPHEPHHDEEIFVCIQDRPYFLLCEVKKGKCDLNGPWTRPGDQNIPKILQALGPCPPNGISKVADSLYKTGVYNDESMYFSLFCLGVQENKQRKERYPDVPQRTWEQVLRFIYRRFRTYRREKANHGQWDDAGQELWRCFEKAPCVTDFVASIKNSVEGFPSTLRQAQGERKPLPARGELVEP